MAACQYGETVLQIQAQWLHVLDANSTRQARRAEASANEANALAFKASGQNS